MMKIETFMQNVQNMQKNTRSFFKTEDFTIRTTFWATSLGGPFIGVLLRLLQIMLLIVPLFIMGGFFILISMEGIQNPYDSMSIPASISVIIILGIPLIASGIFLLSAIFQTIEFDILHKRIKRYRLFFPVQNLNLEDITGISYRGLVYKSFFLGYCLMLTTRNRKHIQVLTVKNKDEKERFFRLLEFIVSYGNGKLSMMP